MKINKLFLKDGISKAEYEFADITAIVSKHNRVGKTTLLRCLLYALGYPIPSMRGLNFDKMEFVLELSTDAGQTISLKRLGAIVNVSNPQSEEEMMFVLPVERTALHRLVFGIEDETVLENLLGTYYFDQEKGWTLLNRGTVIGQIHFTIEDFLRGLIGRPCTSERAQLAKIEQQIKEFRYMLNVADYQAQLDESSSSSSPSETPAEDVAREMRRLHNQRKPLQNEMRRLKMAVQRHNEFRNYIDSMKLRVKGPNGEPIPVTAETLLDFSDLRDLLAAKLADCQSQIAQIDNRIASFEAQQEDMDVLFSVESLTERFARELSRVNVNVAVVERGLAGLQQQKRKLKDLLQDALIREQAAVTSLTEYVAAYLQEFGIDEQLGHDIFTSDLKSVSGALSHLQVFSFKISYARLVRERTGCVLPLIIDSPSGREVEKDTVKKMIDILLRDFADHQIILATIYNPELPTQRTIELSGRIMSLGEYSSISED